MELRLIILRMEIAFAYIRINDKLKPNIDKLCIRTRKIAIMRLFADMIVTEYRMYFIVKICSFISISSIYSKRDTESPHRTTTLNHTQYRTCCITTRDALVLVKHGVVIYGRSQIISDRAMCI